MEAISLENVTKRFETPVAGSRLNLQIAHQQHLVDLLADRLEFWCVFCTS